MKRKNYSGYRSYQYLEPGVDYKPFQLVREIDRVTSRTVEVTDAEEACVQRLMAAHPVISLHDHLDVMPEDPQQIFDYCRDGREWTGYEGLSVSGLDAVFDCLMDGTAVITSKAGWKWADIIADLGMRLCDIAHQEMLVRAETTRDIRRAKANDQRMTRVGGACARLVFRVGGPQAPPTRTRYCPTRMRMRNQN
jgi:membrane dipeptidase